MPKIATIDVTFDRIRMWVDNPDSEELSAKDKEILSRWDFAYDQLKICKPYEVRNRLVKKFNIKISQAYNDIRNANKLFNPVNRRSKDWLRNFIVEDALLQIETAKQNLDNKAWQLARQDLIKIYAIEKNEEDGIDPELLGNNNYFIAVNFGNEIEKIDLSKLHAMPMERRQELTNFLFPELETIEDAEIIMNS